jgi:diaminopimelate decarboxylase
MKFFHYKNKELYCEQVPVQKLAKNFGTPLYVTSTASIMDQLSIFEDSFKELDHMTCYAVKANYNLSVIKLLADKGIGADAGSQGEIFRALKAGIPSNKILFSGVGKTRDDIAYALKKKIFMFKVESLSEIQAINTIAKKSNVVAKILIRINPNVSVDTHKHISTGGIEHKFGIDQGSVSEVLRVVKSSKNIDLQGFAIHIGSQIADPIAYANSIKVILKIKIKSEKEGFNIKYLNIGGGFPITYDNDNPKLLLHKFAEVIIPELKDCGAKILFEPGRFLVGNSSVLLTEVLYTKQNTNKKNFVVVDAGMTELMRPALYSAYHHIIPTKINSTLNIIADIVGPVCESSDAFAHDRKINKVKEGDTLAILSAGAYGSVMASNYNGRLRPAEVLVDGKKSKVIRKRETLEQTIVNE